MFSRENCGERAELLQGWICAAELLSKMLLEGVGKFAVVEAFGDVVGDWNDETA